VAAEVNKAVVEDFVSIDTRGLFAGAPRLQSCIVCFDKGITKNKDIRWFWSSGG
jgi:hypothetical protein